MTIQERQAIGFLLAVTLLGTGVRVVRARSQHIVAPPSDSAALAAQMTAVDSAVADRSRTGKKSRSRKIAAKVPRDESADILTGAALLDITAMPERRDVVSTQTHRESASRGRVDLDVASRAEIEALPWIGPGLAERIVAHREACGPFGSLAALKNVRGVGDRTAERLSEHVTFSAGFRPSSTVPQHCQSGSTLSGDGARKRRP